MKFRTNCSYYEKGEEVLQKYPKLKGYDHSIDAGELILDIETLDELIEVMNDTQQDIILNTDGELIIYDGYIE